MFGWLRRWFEKRRSQPNTVGSAEPPQADIIRLAPERDYNAPTELPYSDPGGAATYHGAHRAGWEFFAHGSYSYLGPDGRPNGKVLGRGACEREFGSEPERAGFAAGFDQAMKQHFQRVRDAIQAHFACAADPAEPDRCRCNDECQPPLSDEGRLKG
jgi:hypothetical protein